MSPGAPLGGVCSPTHARVPGAVRKSPWATRRVKGIDPRVVDSRTRGRACARPLVTLLHALGYRDTLVASLLVVVARPRRLVESTCFDQDLIQLSLEKIGCETSLPAALKGPQDFGPG